MYYVQVAQININVSPEFERALQRLMRLRGIASKSEAIRVAVFEAAERERSRKRKPDFSGLLGAGLRAPQRKQRQFKSEDDLWR